MKYSNVKLSKKTSNKNPINEHMFWRFNESAFTENQKGKIKTLKSIKKGNSKVS